VSAWALGTATALLLASSAPAHAATAARDHLVRATVSSANWAGYAASGSSGDFSSVSASWRQPRVACSKGETSYAAFWVGLDGYGSRTVEQIGTASECRSGKPASYAWYEVYPKKGARCSITVDAGDRIDASVEYRSGGFKLALSDGSSTCRTSAKAGRRFERSSAEVIVEAPSSNHGPKGTLDLADFGSVSFSGTSVDGDPLARADPDKVIMRSADRVKARPSKLRRDRFSVDWLGA
jgi:Peptidase A4 family